MSFFSRNIGPVAVGRRSSEVGGSRIGSVGLGASVGIGTESNIVGDCELNYDQ
jgi:hypothetical protein